MIKKLTRHGNSLAIVIEKPILDLLNIDINTPLEVTTDGRNLIITPIHERDREARITAAGEEMHERYGGMLKRLAE